mgnify:CR=1 FL=1
MLNKITQNIVSTTKSAVGDIKAATINSIDFTSKKFKSLISIGTHDKPEDITYYFLIPDVNKSEGYILQTHRIVPDNVVDESKLVKRQMFQVPSIEAINILRGMVQDKIEGELLDNNGISGFASDTLSDLANTIDESNNVVTGGLLLVGGIICFSNPIGGAIIIGSSLLPDVIMGAVSDATNRVSSKLKNISVNSNKKEAKKLTNKIAPEVVVNSMLSKVDKARFDNNYEPNTDIQDSSDIVLLTYPLLKSLFPRVEKGFFKKSSLPGNIDRYFTVFDG